MGPSALPSPVLVWREAGEGEAAQTLSPHPIRPPFLSLLLGSRGVPLTGGTLEQA